MQTTIGEDKPDLFRGQDYRRLKHKCKRRGSLFVDPEFPPTNVSLFLEPSRNVDIVWKRPGELVENPQLFVEGASPYDIKQGILGNCWFVSACSALTHNEALIKKVIPNAEQQEWGPNYCGIFEFCFCRFGVWIRVVVDDLLPCRDGELLFARSKTKNEFWSALLEKAFAKLYGCYENLVGGQLSDALQDVSGGVSESISIKKYIADNPTNTVGDLFQTLRAAFEQQALIISAIKPKNPSEIEMSLECGLIVGHAYAVTDVRYIELDAAGSGCVLPQTEDSYKKLKESDPRLVRQMIRLQNPWGEKEWNGPWSDGSVEWDMVTEDQKRQLAITVGEDGEFWMPWNKFTEYFTDISISHMFSTDVCVYNPNLPRPRSYHEFIIYESWSTNGRPNTKVDRSGGCQNFLATFCLNHQFKFDVASEHIEVMMSLTQRDNPPKPGKQREPFVSIGIHVMRVECNRKYRLHQIVKPIATSEYLATRSAFLRLKGLKPGRYVVMPTTFAPQELGDFMFRIYSRDDVKPKLLPIEYPQPILPFGCHRTSVVTRVNVVNGFSPQFQHNYVRIAVSINGKRCKSPVIFADDRVVNFDELFIGYSRQSRQKLTFKVFTCRIGKPTLRAKGSIQVQTSNATTKHEVRLTGVDAEEFEGKLEVDVSSYDDLLYI